MAGAARHSLVSESDYLAGERESEVRHEYVDGLLFAMVESSRTHALIAANLVTALRTRLRGTGCRVTASDLKVRLAQGRRYYYPDVVVACGDARDEPDEYTETSPVLVVEILSPSTAATDRREKRAAYQSMPSLVDYLIPSQDGASVERFGREGDRWDLTTLTAGQSIELTSLDVSLPVDELYEDVFPPAA